MQFNSLGLIDPILKAIENEGYVTPTPIQVKAIPEILNGRDILGCAQTGTGKTAAFSIPVLQLLGPGQRRVNTKRELRCLVVTPTRELAIQIDESIKTYGKFTSLLSTVVFGGVSQAAQVRALRGGVDILVATPGRLLDLINQKEVSLRHVEIFVLDEADRMLDMGFINDIKKVISHLPVKRQTLFFSATMPPEIVKLASGLLVNPVKVEVARVSSTAATIRQSIYFVDKPNKGALLLDILKNRDIKTVLVFTRTKHGADKVARFLSKNKISAGAIHGNKAQNARQRALQNFKDQTTRVLVATDIAARGIDVENLQHVINFDLPNVPESYVHRIGRTGRAGAEGNAISFCDAAEKPYLKDIEKLINFKIDVVENHPFPLMIHEPAKPVTQPGQQRVGKISRSNGFRGREGENRKPFVKKRA